MIPTYTQKKSTKYRYYICSSKAVGNNDNCEIGRISASEIEKVVVDQMLELLKKPEFVAQTIKEVKDRCDTQPKNEQPRKLSENKIINSFKQMNKVWDELFPAEQARIISLLVQGVNITPAGINIRIFREGVNSLSNELTN